MNEEKWKLIEERFDKKWKELSFQHINKIYYKAMFDFIRTELEQAVTEERERIGHKLWIFNQEAIHYRDYLDKIEIEFGKSFSKLKGE